MFNFTSIFAARVISCRDSSSRALIANWPATDSAVNSLLCSFETEHSGSPLTDHTFVQLDFSAAFTGKVGGICRPVPYSRLGHAQ